MAYKYDDSEKFRAQLFLLLGTVLCSPICIFAIEQAKSQKGFSFNYWFGAGLLCLLGLTSILYSYNIMVDKDEAK
jgi:hypothetical protein